MGLAQSHALGLIEGKLLQIQTGTVDMRGDDTDAVLRDILSAHLDQIHIFPAVVVINLVARLEFAAKIKSLVACCLRSRLHIGATLPLSLSFVQELLIALSEIEDLSHQGLICGFVDVCSFVSK